MNEEKSQEKSSKKKKAGERTRAYAFLVYEDSVLDGWLDRLADLHIEAFVSPLHDKDVNPDGSLKKPHWHVLLYFSGKKTRAQVDEIREKVLGENFNKGLEEVASFRGYARYLCHLDNPEKASYARSDVRAFGGLDYEAACSLPTDDLVMLAELFEFIRKNEIIYFSRLVDICAASNREWFAMLMNRRAYVVKTYLKSFAAELAGAGMGVGFRAVMINRGKKGCSNENQD